MKVLVVEMSSYVTGALKSIVGVASHLRPLFSFEFAMDTHTPAADYVRAQGFAVHHRSWARISRSVSALAYPFLVIADAIALRKIIAATQASLIHVNDVYNLAGVLAAGSNRNIAVVQHCRLLRSSYIGPLFWLFTMVIRWRADAIVAVSKAVVKDLNSCAEQVHLVYDALPFPPKLPLKIYRDHHVDCRFGYVGNFVRGKGQNVAVQAFAALAGELPNARLDLYGEGASGELDAPYLAELRRIVESHRLGHRIVFHPSTNNVEELMKESDVMLNFSYSESFSMVCLEALTYGLPLIATDCGGPAELIENNVTGLLVATGGIDGAAKAMKKLALAPDIARGMGIAAAERVTKQFSIERTAWRMAEIYETVQAHVPTPSTREE